MKPEQLEFARLNAVELLIADNATRAAKPEEMQVAYHHHHHHHHNRYRHHHHHHHSYLPIPDSAD